MRVILGCALALGLAGCGIRPTAQEAFGACEAEGMRVYAAAPDSHRMVQAYLSPCMAGKGFKEVATQACIAGAPGERNEYCYSR